MQGAPGKVNRNTAIAAPSPWSLTPPNEVRHIARAMTFASSCTDPGAIAMTSLDNFGVRGGEAGTAAALDLHHVLRRRDSVAQVDAPGVGALDRADADAHERRVHRGRAVGLARACVGARSTRL